MSCEYNNCYLPQPSRDWSRVQGYCTYPSSNNGLIRVPYSNNFVSSGELGKQMAMLNKGNILQYKGNSASLTKAQRYSKIAKGQWTNRNKTWGTQNDRGYTNPNATSLKRTAGAFNIAIDPLTGQNLGPTNLPLTCPQPFIPTNIILPSVNQSSDGQQTVPPPQPPQPSDNTPIPVVPNPKEPVPIVIQDGGSLICSIQENICTGETKTTIAQQLCNPTTDSDVPGQIEELCWNDGTPTWYPRQRTTMNNSGNKWPTNAQLQSAIRPAIPTLISVTNVNGVVTLVWSSQNNCLSTQSFIIFQNDVILMEVNKSTYTINLSISQPGIYTYSISAKNGLILSDMSNQISIQL